MVAPEHAEGMGRWEKAGPPVSWDGWRGRGCPGGAIDGLPIPGPCPCKLCPASQGHKHAEQRLHWNCTTAGKGDHVTLSPSASEAALQAACSQDSDLKPSE